MNKSDSSNIITIAKISTTYGVHGWIRVFPYTDYNSHIFDYQPWYLSDTPDTIGTVIKVEDWKEHGRQILVKFTEIDSPEKARLLTNKFITISRNQLPQLEKNEFYWSDLIGMTVINQHQEKLGEVVSIMETGSNDVLIVKGENEHAIPYLPDRVILKIDLENKVILVDWELL